jgi:hypothetical protein
MGYIDGFMHSMFDNCYMLVGNHDTNYQGKLTPESATYTTRLSNECITNLWYRKEGKNYFSFKGAKTVFYCFDTGTEQQELTAFNNYGWEQVTWFAEKLLLNETDHIAIASHILYDISPTSGDVCPIMEEVLKVAEAFNNRQTISVDGNLFDFTTVNGYVDFAICGHSHGDFTGVLNGIPYFLTINAGVATNIASFDLVFVDYDNPIIKLIRVGQGNNRTVNLVAR